MKTPSQSASSSSVTAPFLSSLSRLRRATMCRILGSFRNSKTDNAYRLGPPSAATTTFPLAFTAIPNGPGPVKNCCPSGVISRPPGSTLVPESARCAGRLPAGGAQIASTHTKKTANQTYRMARLLYPRYMRGLLTFFAFVSAATAAPCVTAGPGCTEWITFGNGPARSMIYRTHSIESQKSRYHASLHSDSRRQPRCRQLFPHRDRGRVSRRRARRYHRDFAALRIERRPRLPRRTRFERSQLELQRRQLALRRRRHQQRQFDVLRFH